MNRANQNFYNNQGAGIKNSTAHLIRFSKAFVAYLMITVFLTGSIVMLIEILGARVIAPYFGSSVFIWTAVISITLLSLALGYFYGGRLADKVSTPNMLYAATFVSGAYLFLVFFIKKTTLVMSATLGLRIGSLISSFILFAPPLFLLGMVTPLAVKLYTDRLDNVGSHVGILYFFSTIGSFLGTLLAGFVLIPQFGVSRILVLTADLLIIISAVYFIVFLRNLKWLAVLIILLLNTPLLGQERLAALFIDGVFWQELHKSDSFYGQLKVIEVNDCDRYLFMDGANQGGLNKKNGLSKTAHSYVIETLSQITCPEMKDALVIGLGPGIIPNAFSKKGIVTDVVEIDPKIVSLYEQYFANYGLRKNINIFIEDGRRFIKRKSKKYDIVVMDVFLGDSSPWHLLTWEAFSEVKEILADKGALFINFVGFPEDALGSRIIWSIQKTLSKVFPKAYVFNSSRMLRDKIQNIFFAAYLKNSSLDATGEIIAPGPFKKEVEAVIEDKKDYAKNSCFLLTDEYNPVDFYNARTKELWRKSDMDSPLKYILRD